MRLVMDCLGACTIVLLPFISPFCVNLYLHISNNLWERYIEIWNTVTWKLINEDEIKAELQWRDAAGKVVPGMR